MSFFDVGHLQFCFSIVIFFEVLERSVTRKMPHVTLGVTRHLNIMKNRNLKLIKKSLRIVILESF